MGPLSGHDDKRVVCSLPAGSGMNLLDIRTRSWSQVCLDTSAPHLDRLLGEPLPSASVLVRPAVTLVLAGVTRFL